MHSNVLLHSLGGSTSNDTFGINGQKMSALNNTANFLLLYIHISEHLVGDFEIDTATT